MQQRICIYGAGAVGGYLAAALARSGRNVSVVARGEHLAAIRTHGLKVTSEGAEFVVALPASDHLSDLGPQDVIVITAKATALEAVAEAIGPQLRDDTAVVFAVNGVFWFYGEAMTALGRPVSTHRLDRRGALRANIGLARSHGMIVRSQNEVIAPGCVRNSGGGRYLLGAAVPGRAPADSVGALLGVPGADVELTANLPVEMWRKLIRNIAVALVCIPTQSSPGDAFADPSIGRVALGVMREASDLAAVHGFQDVLDLEADAAIVAAMTLMKPSIVQDMERRRPMEIDAQIRVVIDLARQARVATPLIDALAPLAIFRARQAGAYRPSSDRDFEGDLL